jgi:hypothetical protein
VLTTSDVVAALRGFAATVAVEQLDRGLGGQQQAAGRP